LLRSEADASGVTRFSMLDTLREFAAERIDGAAPHLRARHRAYFLRLARETGTEVAVAAREMPNLRRALTTAVQDGDAACALEIGVALRPYWEMHGTSADELRALSDAAERCPKGEAALHTGLDLLARLNLTAGDTEQARAYAERALTEADGEPARRAAALVTLAHVSWERDQRDKDITRNLDEALALATEAEALRVQADALRVKGTVALKHGASDADYPKALALFERAEALYRRIDEPRWSHRAQLSRVGCLTGLERYDDARRLLAQCERYFAAIDSVADLISVANMTGYLESGQEHWREAIAAGRRCVQLAWERHAHLPLAMALWNLPHPLALQGENENAARLMAFASRFWERSIGPLSKTDVAMLDQVRKHAVKTLGASRTEALWCEGAALTLARAVELALTEKQ
jgi:tetratricopeptide (TPR) repeat protein